MTTRETRRSRTEWTVWRRDLGYLLPGLVASTVVTAAYLATHPLPAYGAGLFLAMAEAVSRNGYLPPETVPGYTPRGVPFAYPPLAIYALAAARDAVGVDGLTLARVAPGLVSTLAVVPTYALARTLLDTRRQAALATVLAATSPPVLQWHVSAGGVVRAPAYLFLLCGLYAGVRLFGPRDRTWLWPAAALFGLTALTHPLYATAFGISYLWLYVALDRTGPGFRDGATVAAGGVALATPWLVTVWTTHGVGTLAAAAGTHGGVGGRLADVLAGRGVASVLFTVPGNGAGVPDGQALLWVWFALVVVALGYVLRAHGPLLPGWFLVLGTTLWKARFGFLVGALVTAVAVPDGLSRLVRPVHRSPERVVVPVVVLLAVAATVAGGLYAAGAIQTAAGNPSQPQYADRADRAAMATVARATDPAATFLVLGDAAEWFPYLANRTIVTGHWGVEWRGADAFSRQFALHAQISRCPTVTCVTDLLREHDLDPDYLYLPTAPYTVAGVVYRPPPDRVDAFVADGRFDLVHRNAAVAVFDVARPVAPSPSTGEPSPRRLPSEFTRYE